MQERNFFSQDTMGNKIARSLFQSITSFILKKDWELRGAFPLFILVLYGELIPSSFLH